MQFPSITVEAAFATAPTATPSWTTISSYAQSFSTRRGRQVELDRMDTGSATLRLKNQDRRFDQSNPLGPYYPNVKPMRRVRIRATWSGVTYPVFSGYAERWPQAWSLNGKVAYSDVPLVDGFAVFGYAVLNGAYSAQTSGQRINQVLTDINWGSGQAGIIGDGTYGLLNSTMILSPVGDRAIDIGRANLGAHTLTNVSALEHMLAVADSENGMFFISRDGSATFIGRQLSPRSITAVFGDYGSNELRYTDLVLEEGPLWNEVRLTADGVTEQAAYDVTSQADYFKRSDVRSGYLQATGGELSALASWRVTRYKDPSLRISRMQVKPAKDTRLWPVVLNAELGDHVVVNRRPPGSLVVSGGDMLNTDPAQVISQESVIEGISHTVTPDDWTTEFWLSPADRFIYLILNDAYAGKIKTGRLAY